MNKTPKILTIDDNEFPPISSASTEPNGLLAIGGDLSPQRLLTAYHQGIFPWYNETNPILWWSPDPRAVFFLDKFHIAKSLQRIINKNTAIPTVSAGIANKNNFQITFDNAFSQVIHACAAPRSADTGTWINQEMIQAYCRLHELGFAHSVEVWQDQILIGGVYGVDVKPVFCAESMFSHKSNGSKIALYYLVNKLKKENYSLIDCQIINPHLKSLGAEEISRTDYLNYLTKYSQKPR